MKVLLPALLSLGLLSLAVATEPPAHGSAYLGGFLCPVPEPLTDSIIPDCVTECSVADGCNAEALRCCPTTRSTDCRDCIEAIATDSMGCDGGTVSPLTLVLNEEECELCVCVAGDFYCHDLEDEDGDCGNVTQPTEGANCLYGNRRIPPGELTLIRQHGEEEEEEEEECHICICGNGVLFCRRCEPTAVTCQYGDQELAVGETVTIDDGCGSCTCTTSGVASCSSSNECCEYNGETLQVGATVPSEDGCNECTCFLSGDVACTERACLDPCTLPVEVGLCLALFPRWYYNSEAEECMMFNYGGCGGNENRFETLQACQVACGEYVDPCTLEMDVGPCEALIPQWYYNSEAEECMMFNYGGCEGNENRFETLQACQVACGEYVDPCTLEMDVGPCEALIPQWYYNSEAEECMMFNYGGCEGNENRFETLQACQAACGEDVDPCTLEMDVGPCDAVFPRWYYNSEAEECMMFNYGGCEGNENRFVTLQACQGACGEDETECPDDEVQVNCFVAPCDVTMCPAFPAARCVDDYCGGCRARFYVHGGEEVTADCQGETECPDDEVQVNCLVAPCDVTMCPAFPAARCVNDYCGGCRARFYVHGGEEVTANCQGVCDEGVETVFCFRRPCQGAVCPEVPEATCTDDYCGGCNARWTLEGEDVIDQCFPADDDLQPSDYPACPAVEVDICPEECASDEDCPDSHICCRGCGSTCREVVNLPYYDVPLACPPQAVSLASDSAVCDLECRHNRQCPGDKICCRRGCSSSCQEGVVRPEPCNAIRELLEIVDEDDEDTNEATDDGEPTLVGRYLPSCADEGFFNPVQVWENNRWCVNVMTGRPIGNAYTFSDGLTFSCPNCTHNGQVFYAGQTFYDDCNTCFCTGRGVAACTRRACLDPCYLSPEAGTCEDRVTQYFFNSESRQCETFVYSGCGGNTNRFSSAADCLQAYHPDSVCLLEWDEGEPCDNDSDEPRRDYYYHFDAEEGVCDFYSSAYTCGGNGNRFRSWLDCLETCDPSNPGPVDVNGNECLLLQCDIPFCGEGVHAVVSDFYCCPICPSDADVECDDEEFHCRNRRECVSYDRVCDGLGDCGDRSDERGDECDINILPCDFRCSEDQCIPESYVCDGQLDCNNVLDEYNCEEDFVHGAPFYPQPFECPAARDLLGACDVGECVADIECEEGKMCCSNNCNQRMCVDPRPISPACVAIVERLSANVSYVPQCLPLGDYRPLQCIREEGEDQLCWCVNTLTGIPYTTTHNDRYPDCARCVYGDSQYAPGDQYMAEDGCNTCLCTTSGESVCTLIACAPEECDFRDIRVDHGETRDLDCLACTCMYGQLNCTRRPCALQLREAVRVEMRFSGDFDDLTDEEGALEELEREVERTFLRKYGQSMGLDEDQIVVREIREGSVIIVVELEDTDDQTGANITVLISQLEQDYNDGTLVIRFDNTALMPAGEITVDTITDEEEEEEEEFLWWYGLIIGVAAVAVLLLIIVFAIMVYACCRKSSYNRAEKTDTYTAEDNFYTTEMKKVPVDENA